MRIFLDTNVLVSAFATRGLCADLFELVLLEHDLVLGPHVVEELSRSLRRKLKLPPAIAQEIVAFVQGETSQFVGESHRVDAGVGQADSLVLGEAIAGHCDVFVTGDAALLGLRTVRDMAVVSPRGLWELLHSGGK